VPADRVADPNNVSTGALATGIGFGPAVGMGGQIDGSAGISPQNVRVPNVERTANFGQGYQPGLTDTSGNAATDARFTAIGGGRSVITPGTGSDYSKGLSSPSPYSAVPIMAFGMGGSRDAGAGPAFTGFGMKVTLAAADVAFAGVIETGWVNRQGTSDSKALAADVGVTLNGTLDLTKNLVPLHQFGVGSAASVAPTSADPAEEDAPPTVLAAKNGDEQKKIEKEFDAKLEKELEKKPAVQPHKK
jgi:hypothetical protein